MRNYRRVLILFLLAVMMINGAGILAYAEERDLDGSIVPYADDFFQSYSLGLGKTSSTSFRASFHVTAKKTADILGCTTYFVQVKINGAWQTVDPEGYDGSLGSDVASYSFSKNIKCTAGYQYRVRAKFYCKKYDGSTKSVTYTSASIQM